MFRTTSFAHIRGDSLRDQTQCAVFWPLGPFKPTVAESSICSNLESVSKAIVGLRTGGIAQIHIARIAPGFEINESPANKSSSKPPLKF